MNGKYVKLFTPIKINRLLLNNRIIAAPISGLDSLPEKDRCKVGMTVMGSVQVDMQSTFYFQNGYPFSKYNRQELRKKLNRLQSGNARVSAEIIHTGLWCRNEHCIGPNDEINLEGIKVKALQKAEMQTIIKAYAKACLDAKEFGFDLCMLHFAHGWLPAQFLSPAWNKRTDEYGGSFENRARFPLAILKAVREAVGSTYPIDMRISVKEWIKNEISFEDVLSFIKLAEPYIDMINLSSGTDMNKDGNVHMATSQFEEHMVNREFSRRVRNAVNIPVAVVGAIMTPEEAEDILEKGDADMVTIGRALLADPYWVKKAMEERSGDIVPCLRCAYCLHWTTERRNQGCSVNMRFNRTEYVPEIINKAKQRKKVVIIGGGVAGMQAAITANERGHDVLLIEQDERLGGHTKLADADCTKQDLKRYKDYLIEQIKKSNVHVLLRKKATREMVESFKPDAVIIAIGSRPVEIKIKGNEQAINALEAYTKMDQLPQRIVIIGGGTIGCELGLELAKKGRNIIILERTERLHKQDNLLYDIAIDQHLDKWKQKITIHRKCVCTEIKENAVIYENENGDMKEVACDKVVLAVGLRSNDDVAMEFFGICADTVMIGDCYKVGKVRDANESGFFAGYNL